MGFIYSFRNWIVQVQLYQLNNSLPYQNNTTFSYSKRQLKMNILLSLNCIGRVNDRKDNVIPTILLMWFSICIDKILYLYCHSWKHASIGIWPNMNSQLSYEFSDELCVNVTRTYIKWVVNYICNLLYAFSTLKLVWERNVVGLHMCMPGPVLISDM